MILTEEEAKTKRCQESFGDGNVTPTGHMVAVHACGGTGYSIGTSPSMCIGSACMAWRWASIQDCSDAGYSMEVIDADDFPAHGYCGKAGLP